MDDKRKWIAEAAVGLFLAVLIMTVAAASFTTVRFVYQGF